MSDWRATDVRDPDVRLRLLDELVAELYAVDEQLDEAELRELLRANVAAAASREQYDVARICLRARRPGATYSDLIAMALALRFTAGQLWGLPLAVRAGADPLELLELGVHGLNWNGEDLTVVDAAELNDRIAVTLRIEQTGRATRWLGAYAKKLAAEARRRRGA